MRSPRTLKITPKRAKAAAATAAAEVGLSFWETQALQTALSEVGRVYSVGSYGGNGAPPCPALAVFGGKAYDGPIAAWTVRFDRCVVGYRRIEIVPPRWWAPWR
jgi:hypothetical protein